MTTAPPKTIRQGGFTLIELLISMAVSLIVITMIAGVFSSTRVNHDVQDDVAQLQENIRISSALIRRIVYHAGHRAIPQSSQLSLGMTQFGVAGINGTGTAPGGQDNFTISFEGDGLADTPSGVITDCLGNAFGVGTAAQVAVAPLQGFPIANNRFEVRDFAGRPWLACSLDAGATWIQLVPDVEGMEIVYGEDQDNDAIADRYAGADQAVDFTRVVALRVSLLFRTNRPIASANPSTVYTMGDRTYGPFTDFRIRRQITITAGVRNAKS
jgi:type IV pilus assembly protein PilW